VRTPCNIRLFVRVCVFFALSSSLLTGIAAVEFYFSDSNLPYDKFMWTLHTASAEHWVPLATVASFKRARSLTGARGIEWVASALRSRSDALEVDETGAQVRRKAELTEPKDQFVRSVYAVRLQPIID
jgi:lupus La protein